MLLLVDSKKAVLRRKMVWAALLLCGVVLGVTEARPPVSAEVTPPASRPNIVYVAADDMRKDDLEKMPLTRAAIEAQGMSFSNMVITDSQCCPSRASTLTGQYVHNHKVKTNSAPRGGIERYNDLGHNRDNIATWLHGSGYTTALVGKYLNEYSGTDAPPGWDEWYAKFRGGYYNYKINENGRVVAYGDTESDYYTDVLAGHARSFIQRNASSDDPFFLYLAPGAPHEPHVPAQRHRDMFVGVPSTSRASPAFNEADVSDKPGWIQATPRLTSAEKAQIDETARSRWEMLQSVDEMVAGVVDELQSSGELENTYVVFTSDNGYYLGEHRQKFMKNGPHEESIEMPLLMRGPGIPVGRTTEKLVSNADFAPTFADIAGIVAPDTVDGRSIMPLFASDPTEGQWRSALVFEFKDEDHSKVRNYAGVRTENATYLRYSSGFEEYYDLDADPYELESQPNDARAAPLKARLEALVSCSGSSCRAAEDQ